MMVLVIGSYTKDDKAAANVCTLFYLKENSFAQVN